jgi:hypothetical protein
VSLLRAMRKHLDGMCSLSLTSKQNWQGASKVWSELAQATQLTSLTLVFTDEVSAAANFSLALISAGQGLRCRVTCSICHIHTMRSRPWRLLQHGQAS